MYKNQNWWLRLSLIIWDSGISVLSLVISGLFRFGSLERFFFKTNAVELLVITAVASVVEYNQVRNFEK